MRSTEEWRYILGTGHWEAFRELKLSMDDIRAAAAGWAETLKGVERPWLCWNVDPAWCLVQQKLVKEVGWTPVVGFDPRVGQPPLVEGAIPIDFNKEMQLPTMWLHFPMEFIFLYCDRLAFWHADLIMPREKMRSIADRFAAMPDGMGAAVVQQERLLSRFLPSKQRRYWEVLGCSTRGASRDQFEKGAGWWMNFWMNPNTSPGQEAVRSHYYYDSGSGIRFWHRKLGGKMLLIPETFVATGHCTRITRSDYVEASPNNFKRELSKELSLNNDLLDVCTRMGVQDLVA